MDHEAFTFTRECQARSLGLLRRTFWRRNISHKPLLFLFDLTCGTEEHKLHACIQLLEIANAWHRHSHRLIHVFASIAWYLYRHALDHELTVALIFLILGIHQYPYRRFLIIRSNRVQKDIQTAWEPDYMGAFRQQKRRQQ